MNILLQAIVFSGVALVVYAIYGLFSSQQPAQPKSKNKRPSLRTAGGSGPDPNQQKVRSLEERADSLEKQLRQANQDYANILKAFEAAKVKEPRLQEELSRREDWVAKSEA